MTVREVVGEGPSLVGQTRGPGGGASFYADCDACARAHPGEFSPMHGLTYQGALQTAAAHNEAHERGELP